MVIKESSLNQFLIGIGEEPSNRCGSVGLPSEFVISIKYCKEISLKVGDNLVFDCEDFGRRTGTPIDASEVYDIKPYDDLCNIAIKQQNND